MNTNVEYDYQDIYDVSNYPHPINYTWGKWNKLMPIEYYMEL